MDGGYRNVFPWSVYHLLPGSLEVKLEIDFQACGLRRAVLGRRASREAGMAGLELKQGCTLSWGPAPGEGSTS